MQRLASHVRKYYKVLTSALGIASRDKYCVADVTHKVKKEFETVEIKVGCGISNSQWVCVW